MASTKVRFARPPRVVQAQRPRKNLPPALLMFMAAYPRRSVMPAWMVRQFVFWFAFVCQFNLMPNALGLRFLRVTDPLVLIFLPFLFLMYFRIINVGLLALHIFPITISFLLSLFLFHDRQQGELYASAFAFFYFLYALPFTYLLLKERLLETFCWGTISGFAATAALLMVDPYLRDVLVKVGLSFQFDYEGIATGAAQGDSSAVAQLLRFAKAGGLWTHGNEAGPVFALAAAAAAYLSEQRRNVLIFGVFLIIYAITFTQTLNRSGFITVLVIGGLYLARNFSMKGAARSLIYGLGAMVAVAVAMPFGLFDTVENSLARRFLEDENASSNLSERFMTLLNGLQVMFTYPFGIGIRARLTEMQHMGIIGTPHNGFIATAFSNGIFYMIFLSTAVIYLLLRRRKVSFFFYAAICLTGAYMFEEVNVNPAMMMYAGLIIAYTCLDWDHRVFRGNQVRTFIARQKLLISRKASAVSQHQAATVSRSDS